MSLVDIKAYREQAVKDAEARFRAAKTTQERHDARRALQIARRNMPKEATDGKE